MITATASTTDLEDTGQQSNSKHLSSVDALRGIAAIYVVFLHMTLLPSPQLRMPGWIRPFILSGGTGVALFFVISAFTLSISWFSRKNDPHRVRNFYLRRAFRILPLFYVLLAAMLLGNWHLWHKIPSVQELLLNVSMIFNLFPGKSTGIVWASWTIGVEMLFYLMFPLLINVASAPGRLVVCFIGTLVLAVLFHVGVTHSHLSAIKKGEVLTTSLALHLPTFVLGIIAYAIFASRPFRQVRGRLAGGLMIVVALIYYFMLSYHWFDLNSVGIGWSAPAWTLLVLGLTITPVTPIVNVVTRFYGRISYSVYLNHPIVVTLLKPTYARIYHHVSRPGLAFVACGVVTLAILTPWAYITYRFVEETGIRFGSRVIKSLSPSIR